MDERVKGAFDEIHAEDGLKARTRDFVTARMSTDALRRKKAKMRKVLCAAAACLLVVLGISGYQVYFTPTSVISIDINPSLEMEINRFNRVISLVGYTEEGENLAQSLDVLSVNYRQALEEILESDTVTNCMSQDEFLTITVVEWDQAQGEEILAYASQCVQGQNATCYGVNSDEVTDAHSVGLSYGKYRAYLKLQALTDDITPEDVGEMTMKEIRNLVQELEGTAESDQANPNPSKGNGNQTGTGLGTGHGSENGNSAGHGIGNGTGSGNGNGNQYGRGNGKQQK